MSDARPQQFHTTLCRSASTVSIACAPPSVGPVPDHVAGDRSSRVAMRYRMPTPHHHPRAWSPLYACREGAARVGGDCCSAPCLPRRARTRARRDVRAPLDAVCGRRGGPGPGPGARGRSTSLWRKPCSSSDERHSASQRLRDRTQSPSHQCSTANRHQRSTHRARNPQLSPSLRSSMQATSALMRAPRATHTPGPALCAANCRCVSPGARSLRACVCG